MADWDARFVFLAQHIGSWSKDRSQGIGAVIAGPNHEIRSVGYNGFPRGVNDEVDERHERPEKYFWTEHSERNAIFNAARVGTPLEGCTIYCSWFPCIDCARAIVQCGIIRVVVRAVNMNHEKYKGEFERAEVLFKEAGVELAIHEVD